MPRKEAYRVQPAGLHNAPDEQTFELSDLDHAVPKVYIQIALIFQLPVGADKAKIIEDVRAGLEVTLGQYPVMAGTLKTHQHSGRDWVLTKKDHDVGLHVNWIDGPEDDFPSFEELNKKDFTASLLDDDPLLPGAVTTKEIISLLDDEEAIISAFQLTFIRGGLILALAAHHRVTDGLGIDGFLSQWSKNSKALSIGEALPSFDSIILDRSRLCSGNIPDTSHLDEMTQKVRSLKEVLSTLPADFKMPNFEQYMFHFPKKGLERLKANAQPNGSWVSTYDSIMAILWKCITRSRLPFLNPQPTSKTALLHSVSIRRRFDPPLPESYFGNAFTLARPDEFSIEQMLAEDSLPVIALTIRKSIQLIRDTTERAADREDKSQVHVPSDPSMSMDFSGSSWEAMNSYSQDFGFGFPKAMRFPKPRGEGFVFVLPRRPRSDDPEEGIEACVCLEKDCIERLAEDQELKQYAYARGV